MRLLVTALLGVSVLAVSSVALAEPLPALPPPAPEPLPPSDEAYPSESLMVPPSAGPQPQASAREGSQLTGSQPTGTVAPVERWYGWQVLVVDGLNFLVLLPLSAGIASHRSTVGVGATGLVIGAMGYALGGPIVHAAHGEFRMSALSLGLRTGLPLVTGFVGGVVAGGAATGARETDGATALGFGALSGIFIGAAGVIAIDAVFGTTLDKEPGNAKHVSFGVTPTGASLQGLF